MLRSLPRTDEAHPDESVRGYALRMAEMNRVRGLAGTARLLGCQSIVLGGADHASTIAHLYGASPARLTALAPQPMRRDGNLHFRLLGCEFSKPWLLRLQRPQVCPACLAEYAYARADWEILFMTHCRIHGTPLVDQCPVCKKMLSWQRRTLRHCTCGKDLSAISAANAGSQMARGLARWLASSLRLPIPDAFPSKPCEQWAQRLGDLSVDGALLVVWAFGARRSADDIIETGRTQGPINTSEVEAIVERAHQRLQIIDAGPDTHSPDGPPPIHISPLTALASRGLTLADRRTAAQLLWALGFRSWKGSKMRRHDPHAQLELFAAGPLLVKGSAP